MKPKRTVGQVVAALLLVAVVAIAQKYLRSSSTPEPSGQGSSQPTPSRPASPPRSDHAAKPTQPSAPTVSGTTTKDRAGFGDEKAVLDAIRTRKSGVLAIVTAKVFRILPDDTEGSEHQRFLVELRGGQTLLVAHNTDLAPRVPVKAGDFVELAGQYEWNEQGGVMHWTHHDPGKRRPGGWIEHAGKKYE
jgi:hypothetical protein